jgi:hypothetical protein
VRYPRPILVDQWLKEFALGGTLLVFSTVVPQYILMSLLAKRNNEFKKVCEALNTAPADGHKGVMGAIQSLTKALNLAVGTFEHLYDKSNANETGQGT